MKKHPPPAYTPNPIPFDRSSNSSVSVSVCLSTMGFFDLNIPYHESDKQTTDKSSRKATRLKLTVKAMELGYTGVAYNRTIKGVMSESDRCTTALFSLSSVLKLVPSLSSAVRLHRSLLGVPDSAPFRQYTRLTVAVDSSSQASALNSGNPILKTYDVVAVQPLNQNAFERACQDSEVDLIAIDFSDKLPFRLKQPMVKAAIERGVYFEITYSGLIMNAQVRRQMISNAKLLVDWTRGKNLVFSSAAPSVTELRGPNDVANLASLLGFPMERAKAALSKNCRSLIANALRKKHYYKEAIRVEVISSGEERDSKDPCFIDWLKWDPISSGEGDLLLDDMARSFSASAKASKTVKPIDFASLAYSFPSRGLQVRDIKSSAVAVMQPLGIGQDLSAAGETVLSIAVIGASQQPESLGDLPKEDQTSSYSMPSQHLKYSCDDSMKSSSPTDTLRDLSNAEETVMHTTISEEKSKNSNGFDVYFSHPGTEMHNLQSQSCITRCNSHVMSPGHNAAFHTSAISTEIAAVACNALADTENLTSSEDINFSALQSEKSKRSSGSDGVSGTQDLAMEEVITETNTKTKEDLSSDAYDVSLHEDFTETEQLRETRGDSVSVGDVFPVVQSCDDMKDSVGHLVANCQQPNEVAMKDQNQLEDHAETNHTALNDSSGKVKVKQRTHNRAFLFPLKRLLNRTPFKRKAKMSKMKAKLL
ncbi:protein GAMETOPHYTE DEFECTIVE 1-like [Actinidia eriantha]|uniref:protein GAMETOPHYTE DEFECTIVE 1-like n=1 Tax=Actinidia eriantha TaxID=165200 RepID=UPI0025869A22|nr:protein GAMETOPHYTE DEFECTIVE 1-like [Actinidia eriantha]XP_057507485.1 protein GAMETOPHYTE DEFECTIVE 1-like [Actinidia eriantha]XP_057507486.1 protein GAMETOPHYTE DEFECTIVE 1-like [Actinidia eriantha]